MDDTSEPEKKLLEQFLYSEEEAYISYCDYAATVGFDVRRGYQKYFKGTDIIRSKTYFCSKKFQISTRCGAMISFLCDGSSKWNVSSFVKQHNHAMILPDADPLVKYKQPIPHDDVHRSTSTTEPLLVTTPHAASPSSSTVAGSSNQGRRLGKPPKQKRLKYAPTNVMHEPSVLTGSPLQCRRTGRPRKLKPTQDMLTYIPTEPSILPAVANCIHEKCKCKRFYLEPLGLCCSGGKVSLTDCCIFFV